MTTARYTFSQFITSLQESLQLKEEISRAGAIRTDHGQYVNHPYNVALPYNRRGDDDGSYSPWRNRDNRNRYGRSRSPHNRYDRGRSRSPSSRYRRGGGNAQRSENPTLRAKRYCFGCGSPDHILSDRKCTPTLDSIQTNFIHNLAYNNAEAEEFANQVLMLHSPQEPSSNSVEDNHASQDNLRNPNHIHFSESFYVADETDKLE